jgi:hypothetical protein
MPRASLDLDLAIYASCVARMTGTHHHTQLSLVEMGGLNNFFCPDWPQTLIFLISYS